VPAPRRRTPVPPAPSRDLLAVLPEVERSSDVFGQRATQPVERALAAEQLEGLEQWRGDAPTGDSDSDRAERGLGLEPEVVDQPEVVDLLGSKRLL